MNKLGYFIQMQGFDWRVKIGQSSNVESRRKQLRSGCPCDLRLLAIVRDGAGLEFQARKDARLIRLDGEWYAPDEGLLDFMRSIGAEKRFITKVETGPAFIEEYIKPVVLSYLGGRKPNNNELGDLAARVLSGDLPDSAIRAKDLLKATKGAITEELAHGYLPTETPLAWPRLPASAEPSPEAETAAA